MDSKKDIRKLPALVAGIKIEPGTLGALPGRLPSFGGRRDLTLGSAVGPSKINQNSETKAKRTYAPNLNVQRNKNKLEASVKEEHPNSKDKRDRHRKDDGKGRRREKSNNLIQSDGVFSEGIAGKEKFGGGRGGGGDREAANNFMPKPKLNLQHDRKIDKEEEERKLKQLLCDDFLDDPGVEPDPRNAPVILPMLSKAKIKPEVKTEPKVEVKTNSFEIHGVKIKQEKLDEDELKEMKAKKEEELKIKQELETNKMMLPDEITVHELLETKGPELIFFQLPDCLPGLKPESESGPARPSTSAPTTSSEPSQSQEPPKQCTLSTLSEGFIGKVQLLKSGKTRLVLGNAVLHIDMGTQVGFSQDLISVDLEHTTRGGDMINLGPVKNRLVCTPDWESILSKLVS